MFRPGCYIEGTDRYGRVAYPLQLAYGVLDGEVERLLVGLDC